MSCLAPFLQRTIAAWNWVKAAAIHSALLTSSKSVDHEANINTPGRHCQIVCKEQLFLCAIIEVQVLEYLLLQHFDQRTGPSVKSW